MPTDKKKIESTYPNVITILEWQAPGRPWQKKGKTYFATALLIMLLVEIILFLFGQYTLMLTVLSLVFISFVLASVPPHDFHYRISSEGLFVEDQFFLWQELYEFYFKKRSGQDVLHIQTRAFLPGELTITLGSISEEQIKGALLPYLPYREFVQPSFLEKAGSWLAKTFPLENSVEKK